MNENTNAGLHTETATLANGCFWCTEAIFQRLQGIISVSSGYTGGKTPDPGYKSVCSGTTGYAECLQIVYDPTKISFEELLEIFWKTHDPTTLNRQGNDIGTQYRSSIFFHNPAQKAIAERNILQLGESGTFSRPIVTTLEPFTTFFQAEDYHQDYYKLNGNAPYCQFVVRPKVEKFMKSFAKKLKS